MQGKEREPGVDSLFNTPVSQKVCKWLMWRQQAHPSQFYTQPGCCSMEGTMKENYIWFTGALLFFLLCLFSSTKQDYHLNVKGLLLTHRYPSWWFLYIFINPNSIMLPPLVTVHKKQVNIWKLIWKHSPETFTRNITLQIISPETRCLQGHLLFLLFTRISNLF